MTPDWEAILQYEDDCGVKGKVKQPKGYEFPADTAKYEAPTLIEELVDDLRALGIEGRHVMVHCSYRCVKPVEGGPQTVVDAFVEAVGSGVVLFPTYDFQTWPQEHYWSVMENPSKMGIITELARKLRGRMVRTPHPIESYVVLAGKDCPLGLFGGDYETDFAACMGRESLFERFIENDGILISLGGHMSENQGFDAENVGFSMIHHSEMMSGCADWRYLKWFGGVYVDYDGKASVRSYSMNVKKPGVRTAVSLAMRHMLEKGVIQEVKIGRSRSHVGRAQDVHEAVMEICRDRPEMLREVK